MSIVQKCMTIMSIIITEEDLCKKHAKKCAKICQFSSLPSKCFQAANDPNTKIDSKPHICAYNYNTRTGFRVHKKTWGPRVLSSTLQPSPSPSLIPPAVSVVTRSKPHCTRRTQTGTSTSYHQAVTLTMSLTTSHIPWHSE